MERSFIFIVGLSYVLIFICLLTGFYLNIVELQALGLLYGLMLSTVIPIAMAEVEPTSLESFVKAYVIGTVSLFAVSMLFTFLGEQKIIGSLMLTEFPVEEAAKHPVTVYLMGTALNLGVSPQLFLSILFQIPTCSGEEGFFRIALTRLLTPSIGPILTILATSTAFGFMHWLAYGMSLIAVLGAVIAGAILSLIYYWSESELAIFMSHLTYNVIILLLAER